MQFISQARKKNYKRAKSSSCREQSFILLKLKCSVECTYEKNIKKKKQQALMEFF